MTSHTHLLLLLMTFTLTLTPAGAASPPATDEDFDYDDYGPARILTMLVEQVRGQVDVERRERTGGDTELQRQITELTTKVRQMEARVNLVNQLQTRVTQLEQRRGQQQPMKVAFSAKLRAARVIRTGVIVYDHAISNVGGAYNARNGVFTAPVPGVYYFALTVFSSENPQVAGTLVQNGAERCAGYARPGVHQSAGCQVVLTLRRGDQVKVMAGPNIPGVKYHGRHNYFSGFLLYQN